MLENLIPVTVCLEPDVMSRLYFMAGVWAAAGGEFITPEALIIGFVKNGLEPYTDEDILQSAVSAHSELRGLAPAPESIIDGQSDS